MASRVTWPVMALWVPRQDVSLGTTKQTNVRTRLRIANGYPRLAVCVTKSGAINYAKRAEHQEARRMKSATAIRVRLVQNGRDTTSSKRLINPAGKRGRSDFDRHPRTARSSTLEPISWRRSIDRSCYDLRLQRFFQTGRKLLLLCSFSFLRPRERVQLILQRAKSFRLKPGRWSALSKGAWCRLEGSQERRAGASGRLSRGRRQDRPGRPRCLRTKSVGREVSGDRAELAPQLGPCHSVLRVPRRRPQNYLHNERHRGAELQAAPGHQNQRPFPI